MRNVWRGDFMGYWGVVMQDLGYELPRIPIPRTSVNKDKRKGWSVAPQPSLSRILFVR